MHKELHSIRVIREYMLQNGIIKQETNNIEDIYQVFKYLASPFNVRKFNSLYILNYINNYLVSEEVAKRKTSARIFEDLIAILFNGDIADNLKRKNIDTKVPDYFRCSKDIIASNKREKIDIVFSEHYGISIKTLMDDNPEINLGSFEKKILFDGFSLNNSLNERKANNLDGKGLGSKKQLKILLDYLKKSGFYEEFSERLVNMYNFIFADDVIIAIKGKNKLGLYFCTGHEFCKLISDHVPDIDLLLTIINRWEGNSIRIDRKKLLSSIPRFVELDFSVLDSTIIKVINEFDIDLHEMYVHYASTSNIVGKRQTILTKLSYIFDRFDQDCKELKS